MVKVKVSGVPYEVDLGMTVRTKEGISNVMMDMGDIVAELERENFMLRARNERLEEELEKERHRNGSRTD